MATHESSSAKNPVTGAQLSAEERRRRRRVPIAGMVGTLIELYDFVIYGTAAALVFPVLFFPALGQAGGTVASLATLGVAFVVRPLGGIVFGHFGDRIGRKKILVYALLLMGGATFAVGLLPSAAVIGVAAPILLVLLRALQGLAAGGEWAGAALFVSEHAPAENRARWTMFPQLGGTLAISLANATFLVFSFAMDDETFVAWGWRLPFLSSVLLIAIGLWIRLGMDETPVFTRELQVIGLATASGKKTLPFAEAIRMQGKQILLGAGVGITSFSLQYLANTYLLAYASQELDLSRNFILMIGMFGGLVLSVGVVVGALSADRVGRKRVMIVSNLAGAVWAVIMFQLLSTPSAGGYAFAVLVAMLIAGVNFGPLSAVLTELFATKYRFTATGLAYNLTGVIGGGVIPQIAGPITAAFGAAVFSYILAGISVIALLCVLAVPETKQIDLTDVGSEKAGA